MLAKVPLTVLSSNPPPGVSQAIAILEQLDQILTKAGQPAIAGIGHWEVQTTLAWRLACGSTATLQTGRKAVPLAQQALAACGPEPRVRANVLDTLAAAQARAGEFPAAVKSIDEAIKLDPGLTSDLQPRRDGMPPANHGPISLALLRKAIHGPCPRTRENNNPLRQHAKMSSFF